ncbi:basic membrane lipoprotein [Chloroherpeton thalassium ATCC 35110]|uniref:Basic membrane lipoprotein n=1 Tax=Chloroherpeton thalassium (strain ATCC 35110 / GB-78) TaxID=517418 RepID=B3QTA3_CHLT3|nr:BMP family ABC transporter substrate-binding protein [Chloroherpeton thalassium]ACF14202.1 basic membrane lipoprotein [Chloroherpeton thalassium ATCC 35110]
MRKVVLLLLALMTLFSACKSGSEKKEESSTSKLKVGLVFDVGGRGDKSFNDASYKGLEKAKKELGIAYEYIEPPGEGADRETALRQLASQPDIDLIFGIGFIFSNDITAIAKEFPEKKFACVDFSIDTSRQIPENLSAITFEEQKGSYLIGTLASLVTKTGKIGFIGGMESPLIKKFERGYVEGARAINPDVQIEIGYVGLTASAFKNPAKAKELALGQYAKGVDIIYQASGASGLGVFEAARQEKKYLIGTDQNQEDEVPGQVVTSLIKAVDFAVFTTVEDVINNKFKGGNTVYGIESRGTDYIYNDKNKPFITDEIRKKVESVRQKIIDGEIKIEEGA